jgi:hypothetical protein
METHNQKHRKPVIAIRQSGCWEWQGRLNDHGYGYITVAGRCMPATHYFWEENHPPVPEGYELAHGPSCNRNCVRPSHLQCLTIPEHRALDAQERKNRLTPEQWESKRKARARKSWTKQYAIKKANGFRRAKIKMPDGTFLDRWVPAIAGRLAVREELLARWEKKCFENRN